MSNVVAKKQDVWMIVLLSGGIDSTILLGRILSTQVARRATHGDAFGKVLALSVNYGQRHSLELVRAKQIADFYGVPHILAPMQWLGPLLPGSSQTDSKVAVPHGHYADESMRTTVVPNRNMMMLSVAASIGLAHGAEAIAIAAHAGDHAIYPDCREEFFRRMDDVLSVTDYNPIRVSRPFANMSKADIIRGAYDSNFISPEFAPPLYLTWSCYEGGANPKNLHCGKCGTCVERKEAFVIAGVIDPTLYADERN